MTHRTRSSSTKDGKKTAHWSMVERRPMISEIVIDGAGFTEHFPLDLADAREKMPQHGDLWDAVQHEFWTQAIFETFPTLSTR